MAPTMDMGAAAGQQGAAEPPRSPFGERTYEALISSSSSSSSSLSRQRKLSQRSALTAARFSSRCVPPRELVHAVDAPLNAACLCVAAPSRSASIRWCHHRSNALPPPSPAGVTKPLAAARFQNPTCGGQVRPPSSADTPRQRCARGRSTPIKLPHACKTPRVSATCRARPRPPFSLGSAHTRPCVSAQPGDVGLGLELVDAEKPPPSPALPRDGDSSPLPTQQRVAAPDKTIIRCVRAHTTYHAPPPPPPPPPAAARLASRREGAPS